MKGRFHRTSVVMACLVLGGCGPGSRFGGRVAPAAAVSPRSSWKAHGDLQDAGKAIDGNPATAAVTAEHYSGAALTIDLGKACVFNLVAIEHGPNQFGFCRRLGLWTSLDGQTFTKAHETPGTRTVTYLVPIKPVLARYVKLQAITPGMRPWSVAEIHLH